MIEKASLWEVQTADVGVFCNPLHREILTSAEVNPSSGLLRKGLGLRESEKNQAGLWVPRIGVARAPAAMLRHFGGCGRGL